jgi:hypothetical protein
MPKKIAFTCMATTAISSICYTVWTFTLCPAEYATIYRCLAIENLILVSLVSGLILFGELESRKRRKAREEEKAAWLREIAQIKKDFQSWKKNV